MELEPRLIPVRRPRHPRGIVLVLHGGGARGEGVAVSPVQPSVLRMIPVARRVARVRDLAVFRLLNTQRGWDGHDTPLQDVRWALARIREQYDDLPVLLVGHSLGGRAALLATSEPGVVGAVALNAYLLPGDETVSPAGRRLLFVHGTDDRVASPARVAQVAARLSQVTDVELVEVEGGTHSMLRHHLAFDGAAADLARDLFANFPRRVPEDAL